MIRDDDCLVATGGTTGAAILLSLPEVHIFCGMPWRDAEQAEMGNGCTYEATRLSRLESSLTKLLRPLRHVVSRFPHVTLFLYIGPS